MSTIRDIRNAKIRNTAHITVGENVEQVEPLYTTNGNFKFHYCYGLNVCSPFPPIHMVKS